MKNATQLKAIIKNLAKEKHISAQLVMQNFMLERLLERISVSKYKQNFILKGGFLIAAMVGLDTRATMDMDATIKGLPVNEHTIREMFGEICRIQNEISELYDLPKEIKEKQEIRRSLMYPLLPKKKIAWVIPHPGKGSGGHRTIIQNVNALLRAGYECDIFVEDDGVSTSDIVRRKINECNDFYYWSNSICCWYSSSNS